MPKVHLKHIYSFDTVLDPKVFQNVPQKDSKMLGRNWHKRAWDPFGHIKPGSWSQDTSPLPQETHFDFIWRPLGPHFLPLQAALTLLWG